MGGRGSSSASSGGSTTVIDNARKSALSSAKVKSLDKLADNAVAARIPQWILDRETDGIRGSRLSIIRETEKAVLVTNHGKDYGASRDKEFWVPKSQLKSKAEIKKETIESEAKRIVSQKYGNYLKSLASSSGVKVGSLGSWDKITEKLKKSGVSVMTRDEYQKSKE